eukprot:g66695.t1
MLSLLTVIQLFPIPVFSQDNIMIWGLDVSPLNLLTDYKIPTGGSLAIQPGVVVNGNGFRIIPGENARLQAIGSATLPIRFNNEVLGNWGHILSDPAGGSAVCTLYWRRDNKFIGNPQTGSWISVYYDWNWIAVVERNTFCGTSRSVEYRPIFIPLNDHLSET